MVFIIQLSLYWICSLCLEKPIACLLNLLTDMWKGNKQEGVYYYQSRWKTQFLSLLNSYTTGTKIVTENLRLTNAINKLQLSSIPFIRTMYWTRRSRKGTELCWNVSRRKSQLNIASESSWNAECFKWQILCKYCEGLNLILERWKVGRRETYLRSS